MPKLVGNIASKWKLISDSWIVVFGGYLGDAYHIISLSSSELNLKLSFKMFTLHSLL